MPKRAQRRRAGSVGGTQEALPALSSLTDVPAFGALSASAAQREAFEACRARLAREEGVPEAELRLACVVRLDRGFPAVASGAGVERAEFAAQLTKGAFSRVAVGDWVALRAPAGHDMALIQEILPRESDIARWKGGSRGERQTLAANVDVVLVVQALGRERISCDRVARSATIVRDCGAEVAFVLTKADRATAGLLADDLELLHEVLGEVRVAVTAAGGEAGALGGLEAVARDHGAQVGPEGVRALVPAGSVGIMLGESGAGKSTLLNALLGHEALETGAVRTRDDAGRHTTVARRMVQIPGAGIIVDAPGLRSLPIVGHERGLAQVFPEISEAARGCRFRDCTHTHEPGCAVQAAYRAQRFSTVQLDAYLSLAREMRASATSLDPDVVI